jgi:hypothetical protein
VPAGDGEAGESGELRDRAGASRLGRSYAPFLRMKNQKAISATSAISRMI